MFKNVGVATASTAIALLEWGFKAAGGCIFIGGHAVILQAARPIGLFVVSTVAIAS